MSYTLIETYTGLNPKHGDKIYGTNILRFGCLKEAKNRLKESKDNWGLGINEGQPDEYKGDFDYWITDYHDNVVIFGKYIEGQEEPQIKLFLNEYYAVVIETNKELTLYKRVEGIDRVFDLPIIHTTNKYNLKETLLGSKQINDAGVCLYDGAYVKHTLLEYKLIVLECEYFKLTRNNSVSPEQTIIEFNQ